MELSEQKKVLRATGEEWRTAKEIAAIVYPNIKNASGALVRGPLATLIKSERVVRQGPKSVYGTKNALNTNPHPVCRYRRPPAAEAEELRCALCSARLELEEALSDVVDAGYSRAAVQQVSAGPVQERAPVLFPRAVWEFDGKQYDSANSVAAAWLERIAPRWGRETSFFLRALLFSAASEIDKRDKEAT